MSIYFSDHEKRRIKRAATVFIHRWPVTKIGIRIIERILNRIAEK